MVHFRKHFPANLVQGDSKQNGNDDVEYYEYKIVKYGIPCHYIGIGCIKKEIEVIETDEFAFYNTFKKVSHEPVLFERNNYSEHRDIIVDQQDNEPRYQHGEERAVGSDEVTIFAAFFPGRYVSLRDQFRHYFFTPHRKIVKLCSADFILRFFDFIIMY